MSDKLSWGILGCGTIAKAFAKGVAGSELSEIVAVASRSQDNADAFAQELELTSATRHASYEAMLADPKVKAVYIATPHTAHALWAIKAAEAGKHILCEKPLGINTAQAQAIIEAARTHGVFLMEAFMYRCHPQIAKLLELIKDGAVGEVRLIKSSFAFDMGRVVPDSRIFDTEFAGGAILDVGCYPISASRLIAAAALGQKTAEPNKVKAIGRIGETGADEWASVLLEFDNDIQAQCTTGILLNDVGLSVLGSEGSLRVDAPWLPPREGGSSTIVVHKKNQEPVTHTIDSPIPLYGLEADVCARAIQVGKQEAESPAMSWADTLGNLNVLDQWRAEIGLTYPAETPEGYTAPINGQPLAKRESAPMRYHTIEGIERPVSQFVMGCDNQQTFAQAATMFDAWFQCGGNTFDTAHIYAGGLQEKLLGQWVKSRGIRDQVNIISKGAHTPHCTPEGMRKQFAMSLERMQVQNADIYVLHRDNPEVPVGEFIDVLNEHVDAGTISIFGGSNWSTERFHAANEYAAKNGKQKMSALSNNFSLARMITPVWDGCVAASDPESREYLEKTQTANFAWSSQARGYFVSKDAGGRSSTVGKDENWDSPDNQKRRVRAFELAERHGCSALNIAAAYVLCQAFPSFALIGPRTLNELTTSLPALSVQLTPEELAYLDLRDEG